MFDIPASIKPGERVKLRRKSKNAPYWKKPEVVKVESVHPLDESIRFWDERIQDWTYLWPEDFVLVPPDSVETAIALDTESKPESAEIDSVSSDPIALDTESKPESAEIDSVSGPVGVYCPKGSARSGELKYFRYSYPCGRKTKHVHIPGGCTGVRVAQERAAEVMELAAAEVPSLDIVDRIKSWSKKSL